MIIPAGTRLYTSSGRYACRIKRHGSHNSKITINNFFDWQPDTYFEGDKLYIQDGSAWILTPPGGPKARNPIFS